MSSGRAIADLWPGRRQKVYEFKKNQKTGALYLEQKKPPFLGELPYMVMLMVAVTFVICSYFQYIQLRTSVECHINRTQVLEKEYVSLQNDNMILERSLAKYTDLTTIYEAATEELGMVPVTRDHVVTYERSNSEFVYQKDKIPNFGY